MRYITQVIVLAIMLTLPAFSFADDYVSGYTRKDGTYVAPHYRSDPNKTQRDNWSTKGNTNPYTGKAGSKDADY